MLLEDIKLTDLWFVENPKNDFVTYSFLLKTSQGYYLQTKMISENYINNWLDMFKEYLNTNNTFSIAEDTMTYNAEILDKEKYPHLITTKIDNIETFATMWELTS